MKGNIMGTLEVRDECTRTIVADNIVTSSTNIEAGVIDYEEHNNFIGGTWTA